MSIVHRFTFHKRLNPNGIFLTSLLRYSNQKHWFYLHCTRPCDCFHESQIHLHCENTVNIVLHGGTADTGTV